MEISFIVQYILIRNEVSITVNNRGNSPAVLIKLKRFGFLCYILAL